jgi:hypothetical protein
MTDSRKRRGHAAAIRSAVYTRPGQPPLRTRLMAGLAILKRTYDVSDEALCDRWVENPYFQYFCGEEFFQHALVFDRSSLTSGQKRRLTPQIRREFKRRAAIEPVIGHLKEHHRMGRNYLAHACDAINAVLAAAGYNFRRLLAWLRLLLLRILIALGLAAQLKLA